MQQKILLVIVVVLALVIAILVGYIFSGLGKSSSGPSGGQPPGGSGSTGQTGGSTGGITAYLALGTQLRPGVRGTEKTVFGKWDQIGITGQADVSAGATLTGKLFDSDGTEVPIGWPGMQFSGPGGFNACCLASPQTAGIYTLKLYLDGAEAKSLAFKVVADDYCEADSDCVCGTNKLTNDCAYGNRNIVDSSRQCPDYCVWIDPNGPGRMNLTCVNNTCVSG